MYFVMINNICVRHLELTVVQRFPTFDRARKVKVVRVLLHNPVNDVDLLHSELDGILELRFAAAV